MTIFAIVIAVLILIMNLSVHVETELRGKRFSVVVRLWKLKLLQFSFPKEKRTSENNHTEKEQTKTEKTFTADSISFYLSEIGNILQDLKKLFRYSRKRMICDRLEVTLTFGKEDAAQVGILYGVIWAGIGNLLPLIQGIVVLKEPHIQVVPVYNRELFEIAYEGNFRMKIYQLTALVLKAGFVLIKYFRRHAKYKKK